MPAANWKHLLSKVLFSLTPSFACSPAMAAGHKFAWPKSRRRPEPVCEVLQKTKGVDKESKVKISRYRQATIFHNPFMCSFHSKLLGCFFSGTLEPQNHTVFPHVFWYWYFPMVQKPVKTLCSSDSWILKGSGFCDFDSSRLEKVTQAFPNAWIYNEFLMVPFGTKSIKINKNMFKSIFGE